MSNAQDQVGKLIVMADYSHTDNKQLMKVVTRFMSGKDEYDLHNVQCYASGEARDIKNSPKWKTRKRKVYIFRLVEVIEGDA